MAELNEFHMLNIRRQNEAFAPPHLLPALVMCVQEEVGELAAAVLGFTGEKKRKAHLTRADVLDAVADAITYLSLVAGSVGCDDLEALLGDTFNMVSDRAGSSLKTALGQNRSTDPGAEVEERQGAAGDRNAVGSFSSFEPISTVTPGVCESLNPVDSRGTVRVGALPDDAVLESVHAQLDAACEADPDATWVPNLEKLK